MEKTIAIEQGHIVRELFGPNDKNLDCLEETLHVKISVRSQGLVIKGSAANIEKAAQFVHAMFRLIQGGVLLSTEEIVQYASGFSGKKTSIDAPLRIKVASKKKYVIPKTAGQKKYVNAIENYDITFSVGPAGTGKTYLAMAMAVNFLMEGKIRRIILTRPAIEAGESLGFLPGDMHAKLGPYLRPLYDALYDMMEAETIEEYLETGVIEIAPLAYMRGRTLNNAFIVLDEAQNCTGEQLKMFLTRLGFFSKTVITGDITQSDLPGGKPKGLLEAIRLLKSIKGIQFLNLSNKDVVRHPLTQEIIRAYDAYYAKRNRNAQAKEA